MLTQMSTDSQERQYRPTDASTPNLNYKSYQMPIPKANQGGHKGLLFLALIFGMIFVTAVVFYLIGSKPTVAYTVNQAEALFQHDYQNFLNTPNIMVNYSEGYYGTSVNATLYELDGVSKFVTVDNQNEYTASSTFFGNYEVFCEESGNVGVTCTTAHSANKNAYTVALAIFNFSLIQKVMNINYYNTINVAGRPCDLFTFTTNASTMLEDNATALTLDSINWTQTIPKNFSLRYTICMDKQYGYPAFINVSTTSLSSITNRTTSGTYYLLAALSETTNTTTKNDFTVPVPFSIDSFMCTQQGLAMLNFTSFENTKNTTIRIQNLTSYNLVSGNIISNNVTGRVDAGSLVYGTAYNLTVPFKSNLAYYQVNICSSEYCQPTSCYVTP